MRCSSARRARAGRWRSAAAAPSTRAPRRASACGRRRAGRRAGGRRCLPSRVLGVRPARARRASTSTNSGAWSLGLRPLRALRSMRPKRSPAARSVGQQHQVDAHALVLVEVAGPVVPPAEEARDARVELAEGVGKPQASSSASAARSSGWTCVDPTYVAGSYTSMSAGAMLKSPATHVAGAVAALGLDVRPQPGQPAQLVGVVLVADLAAVGHVGRRHPHAAAGGADQPGLGVGLAAVGEAGHRGRRGRPGWRSPRRSSGPGRGGRCRSPGRGSRARGTRRRSTSSPAGTGRRAGPCRPSPTGGRGARPSAH